MTVTWPDGRTETFDFKTQTTNFFPNIGQASYQGRPGTTSTLAPAPGDDTFAQFNGTFYTDFFNPTEVYNPTRWVLTAADGTDYLLDASTGLVQATDRSGNTITVTPDGVTSSFGPGIEFHRGPDGRIDSISGPGGATVEYVQDSNGDLVEVTDAGDFVTTFTYEPGGDHYLSDIDDPGPGFVRRLDYVDGRLTAVTDATGATVEVNTDPNARTEVVTSNGGLLQTISTYDEVGHVVELQQIHDGKVRTTTFGYTDGRLTSRTDPNNLEWSATYDPAGNLATVREPDGDTVRFTYDDAHNLRSWTDGENRTTVYDYVNGMLDSITIPGQGPIDYDYNADGLLVAINDPVDGLRSWTYYDDGRVKTETTAAGTTTWTYGDDGRPATEVGPAGARSFTYYDNGLPHTESTASGTTEWTYDHAGRIDTIQTPTGLADYDYDELGNLERYKAPDGTVTSWTYIGTLLDTETTAAGTTEWEYDGARRPMSETGPAGNWAWTWDDRDRVQTFTGPDGSTSTVQWYDDGRLQEIDDPIHGVTTYEWDGAGDLLAIQRPTKTRTFTRDALGRVLDMTVTENSPLTSFATADAVTSSVTAALHDGATLTRTRFPTAPGSLSDVIPRTSEPPRALRSPTTPQRGTRPTGRALLEYGMLVEMALNAAPEIAAVGVITYEAIVQAADVLTRPQVAEHRPPIEVPDTETPVDELPDGDEEDQPPRPPLPPCPEIVDPGYIHYGPTTTVEGESAARASYGEARLTPLSLVLNQGSDALNSIRPPGFISGDDNHARGHLIGKQLGGSGRIIDNLVTLYQNPVNSPIMRDYETETKTAVLACQSVDYLVDTNYGTDSPLPVDTIEMLAYGDRGYTLEVEIPNREP